MKLHEVLDRMEHPSITCLQDIPTNAYSEEVPHYWVASSLGVPVSEVRKLPQNVVNKLVERAMEFLDEGDENPEPVSADQVKVKLTRPLGDRTHVLVRRQITSDAVYGLDRYAAVERTIARYVEGLSPMDVRSLRLADALAIMYATKPRVKMDEEVDIAF